MRFEAGDKIYHNGMNGVITSTKRHSESPFDALYTVEFPGSMGYVEVVMREINLRPAQCDDHGETILYSENREDWICPFCL